MNILSLCIRYVFSKPLNLLLSLILVALGVGLTSSLLLLNQQFQDRLYKNIEGIHMVVGAKGSPLQMILSSVYHIDVPTGNIPLQKTKWLKKSPFVEKAIPLALGDSYKGYRIVGTDTSLASHYGAVVNRGDLWNQDLEVTIGKKVAEKTGLKVGDTFYGSHGLVNDGMHVHETLPYKVKGIFKSTGTVLDQLILTNISSVWRMHEEHDHENESDTENQSSEHEHSSDHQHADEHNHEHNHDHDHQHAENQDHNQDSLAPISEEGKEITAVLVRFARDQTGNVSTMANVQLPKIIEDTEGLEDLGYAIPAIQLKRLMENMGLGAQFIYIIAFLILLISALSMFISLFNALKERKYEISIMRSMGASPYQMFLLLSLEGLFVSFTGAVIGLILSHFGIYILAAMLEETYNYQFSAFTFVRGELYLLLGAVGIGFLASLLPAWMAYRVDISKTLTD